MTDAPIKTKVVETVTTELTKKAVALLLLLLLTLVVVLVPQVRDRILPGLSKPLLAVLLGLSLSLNIAFFLYALHLRDRRKLKPRFGVLWDRELTAYCPACSKTVSYMRQPDALPFSNAWGFQCVQCGSFIPLNDDDGRSIEIADAKRLLAGTETEEPELDEHSITILTLLARPDSKFTAEQLAATHQLHPEHMNHRLADLSKRHYIYCHASWAVPSGPATYHLAEKGREFLIRRKLI